MKLKTRIYGLLVAVLFCSVTHAQHAGDVEFEYASNKLIIEGGELTSSSFGDQYFEAAFGTAGIFDGIIGDPGFEAHTPIGSSDIIGFNLHAGINGSYLHYFDAATSAFSDTHNHSLTIDWAGAGSLNFSRILGGSGTIGQALGDGSFHVHVDFELANKGMPSYGAYGFLMSLNTNAVGVAESDPFWIFLNYGMDEVSFDAAIGTITAVPEPSGLMLVGIALGGLAFRRRRDSLPR